jgi:glycine/D-amino acid oxidase-like deaminating enzyme
MQERYDVLILGAGVIGASVAYYAKKAGMHVALVDKGKVASEGSQAAAGMLAPLDTTLSDSHEAFS